MQKQTWFERHDGKLFTAAVVGIAFAILSGIGYVVWRVATTPPREPIVWAPIPKPPDTPEQKAAKVAAEIDAASKWPKEARFAVCSADGRTVAFPEGREIVVAKDGGEIFRDKRINALKPELRLSPDGTQLAAYCLWRSGIVLFNVKNGKETGFTKASQTGRRMNYNAEGSLLIVDAYGEKTEIETGLQPISTKVVSVVSDDGRTVAILTPEGTRIVREGKELTKLPTLIGSELNRDGSRVLGTTALKAVVLLNTTTGQELNTWALKSPVYHFSPGGAWLGVMEHGSEELRVYCTATGWESAKLPATYSFSLSGSAFNTHTIRYTLKGFHFYAVESTDQDLTVNMATLTRTELGKSENHDGSIQWSPRNGYWSNVQRIHGCLDQSFDFEKDGSLTPHAHARK